MSGPTRDLPTGIIDTHVHTSPDAVPRLLDDLTLARRARAAGYRGLVLKSHHTMTAGRAGLVADLTGLDVFGGLALNAYSSGGLNAPAVASAARLGAKVVWLPTIDSSNHVMQDVGNFPTLPGEGEPRPTPVTIVDESGQLNPLVDRVLAAIAECGLTLATGHLSAEEVMLVVERARRRGVRRVIVTHPDMPFIGLGVDEQRELAAAGDVWFERVAVVMYPPLDWPASSVAERVRAVGVESTIMATDLGQPHNPCPVEGMVRYVEAMLDCGLSRADIETMTCVNPARALGMDPLRQETRTAR
ncbi:DUF6282 family protein [Actinophytocola sp.]|uniref:DUF6282 family protein n=1 Tax=Actinophytocola sp. TaxID=1872138 RepID=UPI003D6BD3C0